MKALKICVERTVRPVTASETRKDRMREELLRHLTDIYEQELAGCGDEEAARSAAVRRFGDTGELTRELQQSVPTWERFFWQRLRLFQFLDSAAQLSIRRAKAGESPETSSARTMAAFMLLGTAGVAVAIVCLAVFRMSSLKEYPPLAELRILIGCAMCGVLAGVVWFCPVAVLGLGDALVGKPESWRATLRAAVFAATTALLLFAAGLPFLLLAQRGNLYEGRHVYVLALAAVVAHLALGVLLRLVARDARRHAEWGRLDLAE